MPQYNTYDPAVGLGGSEIILVEQGGVILRSSPNALKDYIGYTLPKASAAVLGGIFSGADITVSSSGYISINDNSHNHIWGNVTATPTTLAGYGITDGVSASHTHTWSDINSTPTTLAGYGIVDGAPLSHVGGATHLDWSVTGAEQIHADRYTDSDTTDHTLFSNIGTNTHAEIDTQLAEIDTQLALLEPVAGAALEYTVQPGQDFDTLADAAAFLQETTFSDQADIILNLGSITYSEVGELRIRNSSIKTLAITGINGGSTRINQGGRWFFNDLEIAFNFLKIVGGYTITYTNCVARINNCEVWHPDGTDEPDGALIEVFHSSIWTNSDFYFWYAYGLVIKDRSYVETAFGASFTCVSPQDANGIDLDGTCNAYLAHGAFTGCNSGIEVGTGSVAYTGPLLTFSNCYTDISSGAALNVLDNMAGVVSNASTPIAAPYSHLSVSNIHIDWTGTTYNLLTTGTVVGSNLNITNWDTAYGWGNHSGLYAAAAHVGGNIHIDWSATGAEDIHADRYTQYSLPVAAPAILGGIKSGTDITIDGSGNVSVNNNSHLHSWANITNPPDIPYERHITIETPVSGDDITWFFTNKAVSFSELRLVLKETGTGSCVVVIRHDTDRNATGTIVDANTVTSNTTGHDITIFNDSSIPADSFVWVEIGTTTNTDEVHATLIGTVD